MDLNIKIHLYTALKIIIHYRWHWNQKRMSRDTNVIPMWYQFWFDKIEIIYGSIYMHVFIWLREYSMVRIDIWLIDFEHVCCKYRLMSDCMHRPNKSRFISANLVTPERYGGNCKPVRFRLNILNGSLGTHCEIAARWMPKTITDEKPRNKTLPGQILTYVTIWLNLAIMR